jgi:hypothetical protein
MIDFTNINPALEDLDLGIPFSPCYDWNWVAE